MCDLLYGHNNKAAGLLSVVVRDDFLHMMSSKGLETRTDKGGTA